MSRNEKDKTYKFVNNELFLMCNDWIFNKIKYIIGILFVIFIIFITDEKYHLFDDFLSMSIPKKLLTLYVIFITLFFIYLLNKFSIFLRRKVVNFFKNQGEFIA